MTINAQLELICADLQAWAGGIGAQVYIASDIDDLLTKLAETPAAPRVVVMWHSEVKRGEYEERGAVDRTFWVAIARGKGLKLVPGANLTKGVSGGKPLYDLMEEGREIVRDLDFDPETTESHPDYQGATPLEVNGTTLTDVLKLEFSIGCQLPAVNVTDPTQPDPETA